MSELTAKTCIPCQGGIPPLKGEKLEEIHQKLGNNWEVVQSHHLTKSWTFPDFVQALAFTNQLGALAEEQGHHPDILLKWGEVQITMYTHKIDGLTESDFIMAAKIDEIGA